MNEQMKRAKARYKAAEPPEELAFAVASALRTGERRRRRRTELRRTLTTALAACACFAVLVNVSPAFAQAVSDVPLLGRLAKVFTFTQYSVEDGEHLIDVRLPALENTGDTGLEQRVNSEIQTRIQTVLSQAEERARQAKEAHTAAGGREEDFMPIIISVDYTVKCQNERYLSFVVTKTETRAGAYTELYVYNIDLETGRELSLADVLGPDYRALADEAVRAGIAERSRDPEQVFFDGSEGVEGFQTVSDTQKFYLNERENPVILFEKYEIAPGYMGIQEFEVER